MHSISQARTCDTFQKQETFVSSMPQQASGARNEPSPPLAEYAKVSSKAPALGLAPRNPLGLDASVCDMAARPVRSFLGPGHSQVSRLKPPFGIRANTLMQMCTNILTL
jgi:hypothetical protein